MDYLQYLKTEDPFKGLSTGFKPYYKWITFNTLIFDLLIIFFLVLNLIINGLPSIQQIGTALEIPFEVVLNLIINGLPSIQ